MGKFLYKNDAIVTVMVQSDEPDGIKALMDKAAPLGGGGVRRADRNAPSGV